jgi:hypothetical protein
MQTEAGFFLVQKVFGFRWLWMVFGGLERGGGLTRFFCEG